jgi:hypothetical protein
MQLLTITEEILFNHKDLVQTFIQKQSNNVQKISSQPSSYPSSINSGHGMFYFTKYLFIHCFFFFFPNF